MLTATIYAVYLASKLTGFDAHQAFKLAKLVFHALYPLLADLPPAAIEGVTALGF